MASFDPGSRSLRDFKSLVRGYGVIRGHKRPNRGAETPSERVLRLACLH